MADMKENLRLLDQEIRTLHKFCIDKNFNPYEIEKGAAPLLNQVQDNGQKNCLKRFAQVFAVLAVVFAICYSDPVYKMLRVTGRFASLKLLPYFDWTVIHEASCLLENPYFIGPQLVTDDCELCENLGPRVPALSAVSQSVVAESYLKQDKPFIVTDAMTDWPASNLYSMKFLQEWYDNEDDLKEVQPCMFKTNVRMSTDSPHMLLRKAVAGSIDSYYAHWEICEKMSAKVLRQFYRRPYFVPHMVEMAESNWIFVAKGYTTTQFKPIFVPQMVEIAESNWIFVSKGYTTTPFKPADIGLPMMWIGVLKGEMKIAITPRNPCKKICPQLYVQLRKGEILVATDLMWMLDYIPVPGAELIAVGGGGYFD